MKFLIPILILCVCPGCATRKPAKSDSIAAIPGTTLSRKSMPSVRTPEMVKAYPVGRYTDPNYPDEMHERHTVYRREQSPDWSYLPDPPYALPLGPTIASSNPSPSYYVQAEGEINAQQQRFAEVLQEQNRVLKKRINAMQQDAAKIPGLEQEIDRLKKQFETMPASPATPSQPEPEAAPEGDDAFSSVERRCRWPMKPSKARHSSFRRCALTTGLLSGSNPWNAGNGSLSSPLPIPVTSPKTPHEYQ